MSIYPWIRLIKLDASLLMGIVNWHIDHCGMMRTMPLLITCLVAFAFAMCSSILNMFCPRLPKISLKPWMVKHQLSFAQKKIKKSLTYPEG